jgi:hypothetical protein
VIRPALALVLVASGLKLLGIDNLQMGLLILTLLLLAVPLWGALDATMHPEPAWAGAPVGRRMAVGVQLVGARWAWASSPPWPTSGWYDHG